MRAVSKVIWAMGLLQPGIPLPSLLPKVWPIIVIGLTDDFFTTPLQKGIEKICFYIS